MVKRILIVDDNEEMVHALTTLLGLSGYEVAGTLTGTQAIEMTETFQPEAIFLDIGLPDMDGYEVARVLRRTAAPSIALIALSGYGQPADKAKAREAGFDYHLTKPSSLADIEKVLEQLPPQRS